MATAQQVQEGLDAMKAIADASPDPIKQARIRKALAIAESITSAAYSIAEPYKAPVPNSRLLRKLPFPNRSIPHVFKRELKKTAKREHAIRGMTAAIRGRTSAINLLRMIYTPAPFYGEGTGTFGESGGIAMVGEYGREVIIKNGSE